MAFTLDDIGLPQEKLQELVVKEIADQILGGSQDEYGNFSNDVNRKLHELIKEHVDKCVSNIAEHDMRGASPLKQYDFYEVDRILLAEITRLQSELAEA